MDEQKGLFGFLDKYLMGPMSVIAQYKIVRAITQNCWFNGFGF